MNLSYWELKTWLDKLDFCIVGSGITGLSCALELRESHPEARILILEKGVFPQGASTKNAGFACFGSLTEILSDLQQHSEDEVVALVEQRLSGIKLLRKRLGDKALDFRQWGGYEIFQEKDAAVFEGCLNEMDRINALLEPVFGKSCFRLAENTFGFRGVLPELILHSAEGQIDTGKMMQALLNKVQGHNNPVMILNGVELKSYTDLGHTVAIGTNRFDFKAGKLLLATNGFAGHSGAALVRPARAQVLITEPIPKLAIHGTFHMDEGFYYFRNVGQRILFGGGRNLDPEGETTTEFGQTPLIQDKLEALLREVILPGIPFRIAQRWSGIMGVGPQKRPIVEKFSENVACGVRLGGMGVAIGSHVGKELAGLANG
ncbi:NAD(P)/FAD-dependent oxidoreductase [Robiginitalea aurantiaca]|uniref:FAD-dependent oxidoreductase n=1 Tax=Robiginitalea aurantiaca TaxID=3056915 RepID=A0ABT7WE64_9FLAO|nr:FAD-dependent oxidoreductase [Robiginitalea aurantiaca]MDM9631193.1 FAD-dependent oxidoreductase [Robiginitalea aurantiaca]